MAVMALRVVALGLLVVVSAGGRISPMESVINMIEKLVEETKAEGKADAATYDKAACFCKDTADEKLYSITKKNERIAFLDAEIKALTADVTQLDKDVAKMNKEIEDLTKKCDDEQATRDADFAAYVKIRDDLAGAIASAGEAIEMLSAKKAPGQFLQQAVANTMMKFVAVQGSIPGAQQQDGEMASLLQFGEGEDPKASEFHSNKIIDQMKEFKKKFKSHKDEVDEDESNTKHEFDMAQAARKNQIKGLEDSVAEASAVAAEKTATKNADDEEKSKTTADKDSDNAFLMEVTSDCEQKAKDWDARSSTRSQELTALAKALEAIKGVETTYSANSKLVLQEHKAQVAAASDDLDAADDVDKDDDPDDVAALLEEDKGGLSFLQRNGADRKRRAATRKAVGYLQRRARTLKSDALSMLMLKLKEDHFVKVRTMIKDMIAKLEADAAAEESQKGWCDEEMTKSMDLRDTNIGEIEGDTAKVTESDAKEAQLGEDIQALNEEVSALMKSLKEATEIRATEKANNEKTLADANTGLAGVKQAVSILKDFYGSALLQTGDHQPHDDAASGIMGMLDVILSDFEGTIDKVSSEESDAEDEYNSYKSDTETTIGEKQDLIKTKTSEKAQAKSDSNDAKDDLKAHTELKDQAKAELAKLKPACVDTGSDYAEKVARREQEIESLKNAYTILDEMR